MSIVAQKNIFYREQILSRIYELEKKDIPTDNLGGEKGNTEILNFIVGHTAHTMEMLEEFYINKKTLSWLWTSMHRKARRDSFYTKLNQFLFGDEIEISAFFVAPSKDEIAYLQNGLGNHSWENIRNSVLEIKRRENVDVPVYVAKDSSYLTALNSQQAYKHQYIFSFLEASHLYVSEGKKEREAYLAEIQTETITKESLIAPIGQEKPSSRRQWFKTLFYATLGGALGIGGLREWSWRKNLRTKEQNWQAEMASYRRKYTLWSSFQAQDKDNAEVHELIKPLFDLVSNQQFKDIVTQLTNIKESRLKPCYFEQILNEDIFKSMDGRKKLIKYPTGDDSIYFDLSQGVVSWSSNAFKEGKDVPETTIEDAKVKFASLNTHLNTTYKGLQTDKDNASLPDLLSKIIGLEPNSMIVPVLLYAFIFPQKNNLDEAHMFRYPRYADLKEKDKELAPYRKYWHAERPFFGDKGNTARKYSISKDPNTWLSSVYSDFSKKTPTPIRTLVTEIPIQKNGLYWICVDFKLRDE